MSFRAFPDNQQLTKHVESTSVSCLDAGSTPASSTWKGVKLPRNTKKDTDNQKIVGVFLFLHRPVLQTISMSKFGCAGSFAAATVCGCHSVTALQPKTET